MKKTLSIFHLHNIALFALLFTTFFVYLNSLTHSFVWDDEILITHNRFIQNFQYLPDLFTQNLFKGGDSQSNFWRPFQLLTYLINYKLSELHPFGFHLFNTLLHSFVSFLVYLYLFLLFRRFEIAFLTSLIYSIHPIHTEAIAYISGRADSLASFFILLSLYFYILSTHAKTFRQSIGFYSLSFLCFPLALMSKEMAILLPLYMILTDVVTFQDQEKKSMFHLVGRYLPMLMLLAIYIILRKTTLDFSKIPLLEDNPVRHIPLLLRLLTFSRSVMGWMIHPVTHHLDLGYLGLLLFPINLHMERGMIYAKTLFEYPYLLSLNAFLILIIFTFYFYSKSKIKFFGLAFFIIALLPFSDIIPLNANMAEHWLYLPSIGIFLILSDIFVSTLKIKPHPIFRNFSKYTALTFMAIYLISLGTLTILRNKDWKNNISIWESTARFSDSSHLHGNLGVAYGRLKDFDRSKEEFLKAIQIQFNYPEVHNNLGLLHYHEGNFSQAEKEFNLALQFNPNYANAYSNLGDVLYLEGSIEEAKKMWKKAVEINPDHTEAKRKLGKIQ
ncbi:MAG: tetratricopeptide repeat protein [Chlamydiae bacterium]|nr:tetratricopeptide repeat protein [Chlamydiota bacterium]MBI3276492.1 tetratricopeptide repeat protein [Chlamydiota bacterium]